jgi:hypothetical protein
MKLQDWKHEFFRWMTPWAIITGVVLFVRLPILIDPPYYDFAFSFWAEADYLAKSDFDFQRLRYEEPFLLAEQGGRRAYMTSLLPSLAALAMKITPSPAWSFALYRLFTFFVVGLMGTFLYRLFVPSLGRAGAGLLVAFTLTIPSLSTQFDMLGMETPVALGATATAYFVARGKWGWGAVASLFAFLMKASGMIISIALLVTLGLLVLSAILTRRAPPWRGCLLAAAVLAIEWGLVRWGDTFTGQIMSGVPLAMALVWAPDLSLLTLLALGAGVALFWQTLRQIDREHQDRPASESWGALADALSRERLVLFATIGVVGVMAAVHRGPHLPRYYAMAVPLVVILLVEILFSEKRPLPWPTGLVVWGLLINLINWSGSLYPSIEAGFEYIAKIPAPAVARSGSFYERSREYIADLRSTQNLVNTLLARHSDEAIIVGMPFPFFLAYPSFGYVKDPVLGYSISRTADSIPEFKPAADLLRDQPTQAVLIRVPSYFYSATNLIEIDRPGPKDEVWYDDGDHYPGAMTLYRKTWSTPRPAPAEVSTYFQRMAWPRRRLAAQLTAVRWREGLSGAEAMLRDREKQPGQPDDLRAEINDVADAMAIAQERLGRSDQEISPLRDSFGRQDELFRQALAEFHETNWDQGVSRCREYLGRQKPRQ